MKNRIKKVIADVLMIDIDKIDDNSSPETIEQWDSLKQMNIIIALEDEFEIEFLDEEIGDMNSIALINLMLIEKFK